MLDETDVRTGVLAFSDIPQLPGSWWTGSPPDDPAVVWTVWDRDSYYLWGANAGNYGHEDDIGTIIGGAGMAGTNGPTRGRNHPHYIGIITMNYGDMPKNAAAYMKLGKLAAAGKTIVVPTWKGRFSLGTGIGASQPNWAGIQASILQAIVDLGETCARVDIPDGTYWPDENASPVKDYPITSLNDIQTIIDTVLADAAAPA